jgi:hypothetical protein
VQEGLSWPILRVLRVRERALQRLYDLHKQEDEDDEQDKADSAAAVVSESRSHAVAPKAEHQNQNQQKNKHLVFLRSAKFRQMKGVMQILLSTHKEIILI